MAGNTRGKLKEKFEGIHRGFDWVQRHCEASLVLIKQHNPKLSDAIKGLHKSVKILDKMAQEIYSKL